MAKRSLGRLGFLSASVLVVACSSSSSVEGTAESSALGTVASSGTGTAIVSGIGGKCLDDATDATTNDNKIQLWQCNGTGAQAWTFENGRLVGPGGKCLDIHADIQKPGTPVDLYACNGTTAQKWTIEGKQIKSTSGLCLDVKDGASQNGTVVQVWTCNGTASQVWRVAGAAGSDAGVLPDAASGPSGPSKSLRSDFHAKCDGVTDDRDAVAAAFAAAAGNAFRLVVDAECAAYVKVGTDITKPIFIGDGTTVEVLKGGKLVLDNESIPTFGIADSNDVTLVNWAIEYIGSLSVDGTTWQGGNYNDHTLKSYLATAKHINFDGSKGWVSARWASPTNSCALFDIRGTTSNLHVSGMTLTGGPTGNRFIPMAFSITSEAHAGQTLSHDTPVTSAYFALPSNLTFSDITIDGAYFGWQGQPASSTFTNITSRRYGDLEDASGGSVGGALCPATGGCELAPPHLFYFNDGTLPDPALNPHDNRITNVMDYGERVGVARNPGSGNACSLKLGGTRSTVSGYTSYRPDGLMDVLESTDNTIENVSGTFDSTFCADRWPGIRFPGAPYTGLTLRNITIKDTHATTDHAILGGSSYLTGAQLTGIDVTMNRWTGSGSFVASFSGATNDTTVTYVDLSSTATTVAGTNLGVSVELTATPSQVAVGESTDLVWSSRGATSCAATGAWTGSLGPSGSRFFSSANAGTHDLALACSAGSASVGVSLAVATK